ncbi:FUSC family protein [Dyella subtropica]|uniref:FUSC family protein n=1 Tax=Dyella subtropica TaxID=2992127 RepID=UPI002257DA0C|nr:FUSC family protein [Dyella subtropica]
MSDPTPLRDSLRRLGDFHRDIEALYRRLPWTHRLLKGLLQALLALSSASMAYGFGLLLHTQQAFWAALTAIAVTQQSYLDTRASSRDQVIGALIGGLTGLAAAYHGGDHYATYALALVFAITSCWLLGVGSAGRLSASTTTIIMLVPHEGSFWSIALTRLGEVTLGITCALLVTWVATRLESRWLSRVEAASPPAKM